MSIISSELAFSTLGRILYDRRMLQTLQMMKVLTLSRDWELAAQCEQERVKNAEELNDFFLSENN